MSHVIMPVSEQMMLEKDRIAGRVFELSGKNDFHLVPLAVSDWNADLSPWEFSDGRNYFAGRADFFLEKLLGVAESLSADGGRLILAGYSLAGLFVLWASGQTDIFDGVASCSGSLWFPGFSEAEIRPNCKKIYLSLGDRECRTKNPSMRKIRDVTEKYADDLRKCNRYESVVLEMNPGNHFVDFVERMSKGIAGLV